MIGAISLGLEASLLSDELIQVCRNDRVRCFRLRLVETHQYVARLHMIAFADADFLNDSTGEVLDLLNVRINDEQPLRDDSAIKGYGRGPARNSKYEDRNDCECRNQGPLNRLQGCKRVIAHAAARALTSSP